MGEKLKLFWARFKTDGVKYLKYHWLRILGFLIGFIVPLVFLCVYTFQSGNTSVNVWLLPIFILIIIIYFFKGRKMLKNKLQNSHKEIYIDSDRANVGEYGILKVVDLAVIIALLWVVYYLSHCLENMGSKTSYFFLMIAICGTAGNICYTIDEFVWIGEQLEFSAKKSSSQTTTTQQQQEKKS